MLTEGGVERTQPEDYPALRRDEVGSSSRREHERRASGRRLERDGALSPTPRPGIPETAKEFHLQGSFRYFEDFPFFVVDILCDFSI